MQTRAQCAAIEAYRIAETNWANMHTIHQLQFPNDMLNVRFTHKDTLTWFTEYDSMQYYDTLDIHNCGVYNMFFPIKSMRTDVKDIMNAQNKDTLKKILSCFEPNEPNDSTSPCHRLLVVSLYLFFPKGDAHSNTLVFDTHTQDIYHFEPHGCNILNFDIRVKIKTFLRRLDNGLHGTPLNMEFWTYHQPGSLCLPGIHDGLQSVEHLEYMDQAIVRNIKVHGNIPENGLCISMCLMFVTLLLLNPTLTPREVSHTMLLWPPDLFALRLRQFCVIVHRIVS